MIQYYITNLVHQAGGGEGQGVLSEYNGEHRFAQHFERAWTRKEFNTEHDALVFLQTMRPNVTLTILEDTGKVLMTHGIETGLTSMKIREVR